jgi:hypothetical protein
MAYANPFARPEGWQGPPRGYGTGQPISPTGMPSPSDPYWYLNQVPDAGWWAYMHLLGQSGALPRNQYAQRQQNRMYGMYQADASADPNMGWYDWLLKQQGTQNDVGQLANQQTAENVGDFSARSLSPKARYVLG